MFVTSNIVYNLHWTIEITNDCMCLMFALVWLSEYSPCYLSMAWKLNLLNLLLVVSNWWFRYQAFLIVLCGAVVIFGWLYFLIKHQLLWCYFHPLWLCHVVSNNNSMIVLFSVCMCINDFIKQINSDLHMMS